MKIAILSCFYPYRGGISQFNTNILNELGKSHIVKAFNFKRQYPEFLFPGKTQYVTEEDMAVPVESEALLDTANPFTYIKTAKAIRDWDPDILILRYWMSYFAPSLGYVARHMKKHCKVIPILDNVVPHEPHFFDKPFTKYFLGGATGGVTMSEEVRQDLIALRPDIKNVVLPHPLYNHFGEAIPREEAEEILGLEKGKKNLLFFGLIRKYKGLDILINAFNELADDSYQLIIAGEPYGSFEPYQELIDHSPAKDRIKLFTEYISDDKVKNFFSASDLVVLPYRSATQSGIFAISCHFKTPMLVTDVGGLKSYIGGRGLGLVADKAEPEYIKNGIEEFFKSDELKKQIIENSGLEKDRLSWSRFCSDFLDFANSL